MTVRTFVFRGVQLLCFLISRGHANTTTPTTNYYEVRLWIAQSQSILQKIVLAGVTLVWKLTTKLTVAAFVVMGVIVIHVSHLFLRRNII